LTSKKNDDNLIHYLSKINKFSIKIKKNLLNFLSPPRDNLKYLYTLLFIFGVDLIVCHSLILCWVFWTHNKGRLSKFFAFQGYYISHSQDDIDLEMEKKVKDPKAKDTKVHIINDNSNARKPSEPEDKKFIKEKEEEQPANPRNHDESFSENRSLVNPVEKVIENHRSEEADIKDL
jgi:hypothetical protein